MTVIRTMRFFVIVAFFGIGLAALAEDKKEAAGANDNKAPEGFIALFNGKDLANWKGLLAGPNDNPIERAKLSPEKLQAAQK